VADRAPREPPARHHLRRANHQHAKRRPSPARRLKTGDLYRSERRAGGPGCRVRRPPRRSRRSTRSTPAMAGPRSHPSG
jgi:hypothetical protein